MSTTPRNWFARAATLVPDESRYASAQLDAYIETLRTSVDRLGGEMTVCVTGSIARAEPGLTRHGGRWQLGSDVDLVPIVRDLPISDNHSVHQLEPLLRHHHPDIDTTVFPVQYEQLLQLGGRFGADLAYAAARPLVGTPIRGCPIPETGRRAALEGIVHQLAASYAPEPAATPWRTKTALEALRAVTCESDRIGPHCYVHLPGDPRVHTVAKRSDVTALVHAREHGGELPISPAHAYALVVRAAAGLFGVHDVDDPHQAMLIAMQRQARPGMHILDGFQHATLAATILEHGPHRYRAAAAASLHVAVTCTDPDTLPTASQARALLAKVSPPDLCREGTQPARVLHTWMSALRADYYHHLGRHNFGAAPVPEYTGPLSHQEAQCAS